METWNPPCLRHFDNVDMFLEFISKVLVLTATINI